MPFCMMCVMKYSAEDWKMKRDKGLPRFLMFDGILMTGGPFAVVMQVVGYFLFGDQYPTFGEYFSASKTWVVFFLHATAFGLIMGLINWFRNQWAYRKHKQDWQKGV